MEITKYYSNNYVKKSTEDNFNYFFSNDIFKEYSI